ncbi:MAG: ABC transporter substrate-binding protein [Deltaproteobacteria bacterium]|nr:ABC transporter substrate-binding protein [Deltaproteobacteria bacterium]
MRTLERCLVVAVATTLLAVPAVGRAQTPTAQLRKTNTDVERLLKKKVPKGGAAEKKVKADIKKLAAGLLAYDELSKESLKRHWGEMTAAQRTEFVTVFQELIERHYVKQVRTGVDYGISYKNEKVDGAAADVKTVVRIQRKGRMADTVVDYKMLRRAGKWLVWDIMTDEDPYSSLVMNYRSEFNKLWAKDGLEGVMKKIRKKAAEEAE